MIEIGMIKKSGMIFYKKLREVEISFRSLYFRFFGYEDSEGFVSKLKKI